MEADEEWIDINAKTNVMGLLRLIQTSMTQHQTLRYPDSTLLDAMDKFYQFKQGPNMSNHDYFEKFKDHKNVVERLGETIGAQESCIQEILDETALIPDFPTGKERALAERQAKERFLALIFLKNCCPKRYGGLLQDIENEYMRGQNSYPQTLMAAYQYLLNYKSAPTGQYRDEGGLAFYTEDTSGRGPGHSSSRGPGRGSGRGASCGSGCGGG
jgi:hypothetical protein